ncbi:MAG: thiamine phosphate synthase [Algicola sp.]|nr:thiamine phosphate synthase [Algicola sp.]
MEITHRVIKNGVYLVVNPSMARVELFSKLNKALEEGIAAIQIWDHFKPEQDVKALVESICNMCHKYQVPVLINNRWELLQNSLLDGVHFDEIPKNFSHIKQKLNKPFVCGITVNNNLSAVSWAVENKISYISFCSLFPSSTATSCELVDFNTIQKARKMFKNPLFLAGGISLQNIHELSTLHYDGVAVVSGVMSAENPANAIREYKKHLNKNV